MERTLFDKIWDQHVVTDLGAGMNLLHVDRVLLHDLSGFRALRALDDAGETVAHPDLVVACPDHTVASDPTNPFASETYDRVGDEFRVLCQRHKIRHYDVESQEFGILHIIGPELGLTLPGTTLVCGDSHTCTHGGLGSLAWGIGSSELVNVLASQTIIQRKPKRMRVNFEGNLQEGVTPKDMILHVIGQSGVEAGDGFAVEYAGSAIRKLNIEGRLTVCNLSIEMGAKYGMVAPDEKVFDYLRDRKHVPQGEVWDKAGTHWRKLHTDDDAIFEKEVLIEVEDLKPHVTWGTSPEHVIAIDGAVPGPDSAYGKEERLAVSAALDYIGLEPGTPIEGVDIDWVFIGSCTNSRISDLRAAARVIKGRKVVEGVTAWVVPGSAMVKAEAESEGLDKIFIEAGFDWRVPSCSLCVGANGDILAPGERSISTSNRNFVGRQGPGARTHLASPAMAAAAAITGKITDVRKLI